MANPSKERPHTLLICKKCGKEMQIRSDYVKHHTGICTSCQKTGTQYALKHGDYKTRLYRIWLGLPHRRYKNHNPRICDEWKDYHKFKEWS